MRIFTIALLFAAFVFITGCQKMNKDYAGVKQPTDAPSYNVTPSRH